MQQLEKFCKENNKLANVPFEKIEWQSGLLPSAFVGTALFHKLIHWLTKPIGKEDFYSIAGDRVTSVERHPQTDQPLYTLNRLDQQSLVTASTLNLINEHFKLVGASKLAELKSMLEQTRSHLAEVTSVESDLDINVHDSFTQVSVLPSSWTLHVPSTKSPL